MINIDQSTGTEIAAPADIAARADTATAPAFNGGDILRQSVLDRAPVTPTPASTGSGLAPLTDLEITDLALRAGPILDRGTPAGQGHFTSANLAAMLEDPSIKGKDAVDLASLYELSVPQNVGAIQTPDRTPLDSKATIAELVSAHPDRDMSMYFGADNGWLRMLGGYMQNRTAAPHSDALFADSQHPLQSIKAADIHQGLSGDCYFEGPLAEIAAENPQIIRNAIRTNSDGTFTVTFPGDTAHPVTVSPPTDAELALYNGASPDGIWPAVMEKAFARYTTSVLHRPLNGLSPEDATAAGDAGDALQLLTGHDIYQLQFGKFTDNVSKESEQATQVVPAALGSHHSIVLGTSDNAHDTAGLMNTHTYSVVGFQPGADGGRIVLRNPDQDDTAGDPPSISVQTLKNMNAVLDIETSSKP